MAVPETAMDEYDLFPRPEDQVGLTGQVPPVEAESVAHPVDKAPNEHFRLRVLGAHLSHLRTSLLGRESVHPVTLD